MTTSEAEEKDVVTYRVYDFWAADDSVAFEGTSYEFRQVFGCGPLALARREGWACVLLVDGRQVMTATLRE